MLGTALRCISIYLVCRMFGRKQKFFHMFSKSIKLLVVFLLWNQNYLPFFFNIILFLLNDCLSLMINCLKSLLEHTSDNIFSFAIAALCNLRQYIHPIFIVSRDMEMSIEKKNWLTLLLIVLSNVHAYQVVITLRNGWFFGEEGNGFEWFLLHLNSL